MSMSGSGRRRDLWLCRPDVRYAFGHWALSFSSFHLSHFPTVVSCSCEASAIQRARHIFRRLGIAEGWVSGRVAGQEEDLALTITEGTTVGG